MGDPSRSKVSIGFPSNHETFLKMFKVSILQHACTYLDRLVGAKRSLWSVMYQVQKNVISVALMYLLRKVLSDQFSQLGIVECHFSSIRVPRQVPKDRAEQMYQSQPNVILKHCTLVEKCPQATVVIACLTECHFYFGKCCTAPNAVLEGGGSFCGYSFCFTFLKFSRFKSRAFNLFINIFNCFFHSP